MMTLFSAPDEPWSHRTRIVLAEKGIEIDIVNVAPGQFPEDLLDLNPYHTRPRWSTATWCSTTRASSSSTSTSAFRIRR